MVSCDDLRMCMINSQENRGIKTEAILLMIFLSILYKKFCYLCSIYHNLFAQLIEIYRVKKQARPNFCFQFIRTNMYIFRENVSMLNYKDNVKIFYNVENLTEK